MNGLKKIVTLLICLIMTATLAFGCAPQQTDGGAVQTPDAQGTPADSAAPESTAQATETTVYQETITIAPSLDFTGTDIQNNFGGTAKSVYILVFDTLVEKDTETNELIPGLATSWEQKSDTIWEFKLRENVKFHDGSAFTAEDVKFTIERGKTQSSSKGKLASIANVIVVDDYTVQLELDPIDCDIIYKLSDPNTSILCSAAFANGSEEDANMIGTGPFKYEEWVQGDYLTLVRNDDFWGEAPKTKNMVIRYIPEAASRLIALQTGEVDICVDPPAVDLHYVAEDANLSLLQINSSTLRIVLLNTMVEPFTNGPQTQALGGTA